MQLNKFIKYLIIVNGILLLLFLLVGGGIFAYNILRDLFGRRESVIVGARLDDAKKKKQALQGIQIAEPIEIYNSKNRLIKVSVKTFQQPRDISYEEQARKSSGYYNAGEHILNFIFLNEKLQPIGKLLNKKAFIVVFQIPQGLPNPNFPEKKDSTVKNIAYQIVFDDSNKDGLLNQADDNDLYISDLNGSNLTQVGKGVEVLGYHFQNNHSEIFIRFRERSKKPEEHKREHFALYTIATKEFRVLKAIDKELDAIEKILID